MATTQFADMDSLGRKPIIRTRAHVRWAAFGLFLALLTLAVVACGTVRAADPSPTAPAAAASAAPGAGNAVTSPAPSATPLP